jgi:hypothetical protein
MQHHSPRALLGRNRRRIPASRQYQMLSLPQIGDRFAYCIIWECACWISEFIFVCLKSRLLIGLE